MRRMTLLFMVLVAVIAMLVSAGCAVTKRSDDVQREDQEKLLAEGTAQTGMPAIKNFRERKIMKDVLERRDQNGLVTYTYVENLQPTVIHGKTSLGGKFTFLGETIGYPIPYATQYTNPQKGVGTYYPLPQADPNGLFSPASAEGTWILMYDPINKQALAQYMEPRVACFTFKLPVD